MKWLAFLALFFPVAAFGQVPVGPCYQQSTTGCTFAGPQGLGHGGAFGGNFTGILSGAAASVNLDSGAASFGTNATSTLGLSATGGGGSISQGVTGPLYINLPATLGDLIISSNGTGIFETTASQAQSLQQLALLTQDTQAPVWSGSDVTAFTPSYSSLTWTGTNTGSGAAYLGSYFSSHDAMAGPSVGATLGAYRMFTGGATATGPRQALEVLMEQTSTTGNALGSPAHTYDGAVISAIADANDNGTGITPTTANSALNAVNAVEHWKSGATNWVGGSAIEADTWAEAGSSLVDKTGLLVSSLPGDVVHGTQDDDGIAISGQGAGFNIALAFGQQESGPPVPSTGTLIAAVNTNGTGTYTVGTVMDFRQVASTYLLRANAVSIDGSGNANFGNTLSVGSAISLGTSVGAGGTVSISTPNGSNINLNPQGAGVVQVESGGGTLATGILNLGGINVPIVSGSPTPILNLSGGLTGSITTGVATQWNNISVSADTASVGQLLADLAINHNFGGPGFSGGRAGFLTNFVQTGAVAGTPGVFANVIEGMQSSVTLNNSFGGSGTTPSTAAGFATTLNPFLSFNSGFVNGGGGSGEEIDVTTQTGASFMDVIGLLVTRLGNGSQAARADDGIVLGGATPSSGHGWKTLISLGYGSGDTGIDPGGTVLGVDASSGLTAAYGVNLSAMTFTAAALKLPGFTVDGTGNITITSPATGTAASYACFTSGGKLISSATAC